MHEVKKLDLWKSSLGKEPRDELEKNALETLRSNLSTFRDRAAQLTDGIRAQFPQLTIHDVTHLDALWETADLIAGSKLHLNPAEAFVLGGAILLHDAAHCFEAYERGKDGVRETTQWKDEFAVAQERMPNDPISDVQNEADFAAIRVLHAHAAERLATASWDDDDGNSLFLIESSALRKAYGEIIGTIAASHHWSIEQVSELPQQLNAPAALPTNWRINPVKIACLLRCADAAHIDERRAPDFLRALIRRVGLSADHWTGQNYLNRADVDQTSVNKDVLLITANTAFEKSHASSWWVAFDALQLIDREIRSSNDLLRSVSNPNLLLEFAIKSVKGAESPEEASKYLKTRGWFPCSAKLHVSNVQGLVRELGGEKLYGAGQPLSVVLRELLQNARDAITARSFAESESNGRIIIRTLKGEDESIVLEVEDNGVGMSERVLTGPFLDFGTSFWASDLVKEEWPGLRSSGQQMVGRFGIGFYSTFMIASSVEVTSRRFDQGIADAKTLEFRDGVTLRPTLSSSYPSRYTSQSSTLVSLRLDDPNLIQEAMEVHSGVLNVKNPTLSLEQYISIIVAGFDTDVFLQKFGGPPVLIHKGLSTGMVLSELEHWARNLFDWKSVQSIVDQNSLNELYKRLSPVFDKEGRQKGIAALATKLDRIGHGIHTVGGLSQTVTPNTNNSFLGVIDAPPGSAKREPDQTRSYELLEINDWLDQQIDLLEKAKLGPAEWAGACYSIASFGGDPLGHLQLLVYIGQQPHFVDGKTLVSLAKSRGLAFYGSTMHGFIETHQKNGAYGEHATFIPLGSGPFNSLAFENDEPTERSSLISCFYRLAAEEGLSITRHVEKEALDGTFGKIDVHTFKATAQSQKP